MSHALRATVTMQMQMQAPRTALENFKLNNVLRMILETMYRARGFRRAIFCPRDAKTETLTSRFGLDEGAEAVAASFKVPLKAGSDLFTAVCITGADTLVADATVAHIGARLPARYRTPVNAPAFLLLPIQLKGAPCADLRRQSEARRHRAW